MSTTNENHIARVAKKRQKNFTLSRELSAVLERNTPDLEQSQWVERVLWRALIDEHGREAIEADVQDVQDEIEAHALLDEPEAIEL